MRRPLRTRVLFICAAIAVLVVALAAESGLAGQLWTRYGANPVLRLSAQGFDSESINSPVVLRDETGYKMYYEAGGGYGGGIGLAMSKDGVNWLKHFDENPVLSISKDSWDSESVGSPFVMKDRGIYKMWYTGAGAQSGIGYATSTDGVHWRKQPGPVLLPQDDGWDQYVSEPWVIVDGSGYRMYYTGGRADSHIGFATSSNGVAWTKYSGNPVLRATSPESCSHVIASPSVYVSGGYHLWYSSITDPVICYATSLDGIAWTADQLDKVVLRPQPPNEPCYAARPSVLKENDSARMWYVTGCYNSGIALAWAPLPPAIPTQTPTATPVRTGTPIAYVQSVSLPLIVKNLPAPAPTPTATVTPVQAPPGWVAVTTLDMEGTFPGVWQVRKADGVVYQDYFWGRTVCRQYSGRASAWAIGQGAVGGKLGCGAPYPDWAASWMIAGPFNLADATAAELRLKLWLNTEPGYDGLCRLVSVDGGNFYGACTTGTSAGWIDRSLDLAAAPELGNLLGRPSVWVALVFVSDGSTSLPDGAYVDNVVLRKCTSGNCPAFPAPALEQERSDVAEYDITLSLPRLSLQRP